MTISKKKVRERTRASISLFDAQSIWQFDTIRRHLIIGLITLENCLQDPKIHPLTLYKIVVGLGARFAATRWGENAPTFPNYQHTDLQACFDPVFSYIEESLALIQEPYRIHLFDKEDRLFYLKLQKKWTGQPLVIGLRAPLTHQKIR